jgi:hypothetical protein
MNKTQYFLKKHSSTILTVVGATGVVATAVLSVKATPKALILLEDAKKEKGEELTPVEIVKVAWKPYIPAVVAGASTIACIFGANILNTKNQASLMSAYALLDQSYKEYRNKVIELYDKEADLKVKSEMANSRFDENMELDENKLLFFDYQSMQFFEATMEHVMQAECAFKELLHTRGYACMNEYYEMLGIPGIPEGSQLGWFDTENIDPYGCEELEFEYQKVVKEDGRELWIIDTNLPPTVDYIL